MHTNPEDLPPRVWEGDRRKIKVYDPEHQLVHIGWWLEPEERFVPITELFPGITGSAHPVYCEID